MSMAGRGAEVGWNPGMRRAVSAGALELKHFHPTIRLDALMRSGDDLYKPGDSNLRGDTFLRKMNTFGRVRPSTTFSNESRAGRPMQDPRCVHDASNLPPSWMDSRADPREGSFIIEKPPAPDDSFIALYKNHSLMLPSERLREAKVICDSEKKWRQDKRQLFDYKKRKMCVQRKHRTGILGVDSLLHEGSENFVEEHQHYIHDRALKEAHAARRRDFLAEQNRASDDVAFRDYNKPLEETKSGSFIPLQHKHTNVLWHPHRFIDTHARLFPKHNPSWDPERAKALWTHDRRGREWDMISGKDFQVAELAHRDAPSEVLPFPPPAHVHETMAVQERIQGD